MFNYLKNYCILDHLHFRKANQIILKNWFQNQIINLRTITQIILKLDNNNNHSNNTKSKDQNQNQSLLALLNIWYKDYIINRFYMEVRDLNQIKNLN